MTLEWWEYSIMAVSVYLTVFLINFFLKKINDMHIEEKYNVLYNNTANQYTQVNNSLNLNKECLVPVIKYPDGGLQFHKRTVNDLEIMSEENCLFARKSLTLSATNSRINGRTLKTGHYGKQETNTQNGLNSWIIDLVNNNIINGVFTPKA